MDKLLERLIDSFGVSGHEQEIRETIKSEIEKYNCEISEDKMGNLIVKTGSGNKKMMFSAHMDTIGVIATYIDKNGFVRIGDIGNYKIEEMSNCFVRFRNGTIGKICAIKSNPKIEDLYVELGLDNREAVLEKVKEGDVACLIGNTLETGSRLIAPNLDNRIGCHILINVIKEIINDKINTKSNNDWQYYFVFSTQNLLGGRGARAAAYAIEPDCCIVVDMEEAGDRIGGESGIQLDQGPVVRVIDKTMIMHHEIKEMLDNAADKCEIKLQYSVGIEGSDGTFVHKEKSGVKTGVIAVPCRYLHSSGEMISMIDVEKVKKILLYLCTI
jgi:tetrahedral aminopeptidase